MIDEQQPAVAPRESFGWKKYYDLEEIYNFLDQLIEQYSKILTNIDYGKSYENRTLRAIKVSHKPVNLKVIQLRLRYIYSILFLVQGKPTIFIESTIHAREWITAATATYFLNELLTSSDPEIRELADNYDWIIVPVLNVDGYTYSHSKVKKNEKCYFWTFLKLFITFQDRMWRKTRKPYAGLYYLSAVLLLLVCM